MLRLGQIDYTNTLPFFYYFDRDAFPALDVIKTSPAELNRKMQSGEVDMGPMSSFAYAKQADDLLLFPGLSVSSYGPVGSIFLFAHRPLHTYREPSVVLTDRSATSVVLAKIILEKFFHLSPHYETAPPDLDTMMLRHDVALLIGDEALRAYRTNRSFYTYDLGDLWRSYTGQWMTFALFAVRKRVYEAQRASVERIFKALRDSKWQHLSDPEPLVRYVASTYGGDRAFWYQYFLGLAHDFAEEQRSGLLFYYQEAVSLGLLERVPTFSFISDTSDDRVVEDGARDVLLGLGGSTCIS